MVKIDVNARHATEVSGDIVLLFWKRLSEHNEADMLIFINAVDVGEKRRLMLSITNYSVIQGISKGGSLNYICNFFINSSKYHSKDI